jgi:hypothetical protein
MIRTGAINWQSPVSRSGLNDGLVSWWLARGPRIGGGTWFDIKGNNHGTLTNGPTWNSSTRFGASRSLSLDGSNDYVNCGTGAVVTGVPLTIIAWIRTTDSSATFRDPFALGNTTTANRYCVIQIGTTHLFRYALFGATTSLVISSTATVNDGVWHMLCGVSSATNSHAAYLDGVSIGTSATDTGTLALDVTTIGGLCFGSATPIQLFPGQMDDVRVYNRALSSSDIFAIYSDSLAGYPLTLNRIERRVGKAAAASTSYSWWAWNQYAASLQGAA